jgi:HSP20 family protein
MMAIQSLTPWQPESISPWQYRSSWEEDRPMANLRRFMSDMMESFGSTLPRSSSYVPLSGYSPRLDLSEDERKLHIKAELPGVKASDIDISMSNGTLTLRGENKAEKEERTRDFYRHECVQGAFARTIPLPTEVDKERVTAKLHDGVLEIDLPKSETAQQAVKHIAIKS